MNHNTKEPVLIIMAAGMGSRYGGLKQMDPIGSGGELIIDFSLYDAFMAGFKKAIFIIKKDMEADFRSLMDNKAGNFIDIEYAFQELSDLPTGYHVPSGREKPWGTCQAVLAARHLVDGPFAVINADDFYGADAFHKIYDFLIAAEDDSKCCMIGYRLENTLTENGHVSRGICDVSEDGFLIGIEERTNIMWVDEEIMFTEDEGKTWSRVPKNAVASMNFWGFSKGIMNEISEQFPAALDKIQKENPLKGEFFLPAAVAQLINESKARFQVLMSQDKWHGVTYREDRASVVSAIQSMKDKGIYPEILWRGSRNEDY
ncbi:MAG: sugar phosphate nucleotidyltransferase [Clostridiales bacterium]|nr:sugar phosphate nucleotidyltransferase [Clostridiales bacterium]